MVLAWFVIFIALDMLVLAHPALAGPIEDLAIGYDAYSRMDLAKALARFQKAAEDGNVTAQDSLGVMHANGEGVPRNYALALMWFEIASENVPEADTSWQVRLAEFKSQVALHLTPAEVIEARRRAQEWKSQR